MFSLIKRIKSRSDKLLRRINKVSFNRIKADLDKLPIHKGDTVFIHSALSSLGYFNFDPKKIIEIILEKIGPEGNLLMPGFPTNGYTIDYLKANPVFDVLNTPSRMGLITEKLRKEFKSERSLHPSHSVIALGPLAKKIVEEHHLDANPFGMYSPFYKFLTLKNIKVLGLGTTIFPFTIFRVFESINHKTYPVKVFHDEQIKCEIIDQNQNRFPYTTYVHNPEASNLRRNMLFENYFMEKGMVKKYKIGRSTSFLLFADGFLDEMKKNYESGNMPYLGHYKDFEKNKVNSSRLFKRTHG